MQRSDRHQARGERPSGSVVPLRATGLAAFAIGALAVMPGCWTGPVGVSGHAVEPGPGDPDADISAYRFTVAVVGGETTTFECRREPYEIDTEPPFYIFACPPRTIALAPTDRVSLTIEFALDGRRHHWDDLAAAALLCRTTCGHIAGPEGESFDCWDDEVAEIGGFDINAAQVPGSSYYGNWP